MSEKMQGDQPKEIHTDAELVRRVARPLEAQPDTVKEKEPTSRARVRAVLETLRSPKIITKSAGVGIVSGGSVAAGLAEYGSGWAIAGGLSFFVLGALKVMFPKNTDPYGLIEAWKTGKSSISQTNLPKK